MKDQSEESLYKMLTLEVKALAKAYDIEANNK